MSTDGTADPAKAGKLTQQIVALLVKEDSVTRHRVTQAALMLLGESAYQDGKSHFPPGEAGNEVDLATFFNREEKLKPSDYAYLCAAYHFSQYGNAPFSPDDLRAIAAEAGVVLPDRLDMTLKQAAHNGKKFFQVAGRDSYKPTASAGMFFKETWDVKPGRKTKELSQNAQS